MLEAHNIEAVGGEVEARRTQQDGFVLVDMLVGLTLLGLGFGLAISASTQALKAGRQARSIGEQTRALILTVERQAGQPGGALSQNTIIADNPSAWSVCELTLKAQGDQTVSTYRFCKARSR